MTHADCWKTSGAGSSRVRLDGRHAERSRASLAARASVAATVALCGAVASGATWKGTTGGNLDDATNWNLSGTTYAIRLQQSGPFTISGDGVGIPNGTASSRLQYEYSPRAYTNHFAAGTLSLAGLFYVQGGATLVQESGILSPSSDGFVTAQDVGTNVSTTNTRYVISGADAQHYGTTLKICAQSSAPAATGPVQPDLIVENGGNVTLSGDLQLFGGWSVSRSRVTGARSIVTANALQMGNTEAEKRPGLVRELAFDDFATGTFNATSLIGGLSGGNWLAVRNHAAVEFKGAVYLSSTECASSNTVMEVDGGTVTVANSIAAGSSAGAWGNGLVIRNGGLVRLTGDSLTAVKIGEAGHENFAVVTGAGSALDCGNAKLFIGGQIGSRDGTRNGNALTIADGASFATASEAHVGRAGNDCRLSVTNGSTFVAGKLCLYPSGVFYAEDSSVTITNGITYSEGGGEATFRNSTVHFALPATVNLESNGGMISFHGSEVTADRRFNPSGAQFAMRFDDSRFTFAPNEWFITGTQTDASETRRLVFEGADPHLKITGSSGFYLRGAVTLEFNLSSAGFSKDHPVIDLQHASAKFNGDAATKSDRTLLVNVSESCPSGTYTLLRGAGADTLFADGTVTCTSPRARVVTATVDGVAEVQVKVRGGLVIYVL